MNLQAAVQFIEANGDDVEKAWLKRLLTGGRPNDEIRTRLLDGQRKDGSWPAFWAPHYSSLDATCYRLYRAEALGIRQEEPAVEQATRFLIQRQRRDGTWEEEAFVAEEAPPWVKPGDPAGRLYLTANCGYWLAALSSPERTPDHQDPAFESAMRAGKALLISQDTGGKLPSYLQTLWLAAALWYFLGFNQASTSALERLKVQLSSLDAGELSWMSASLYKAGVPPEEAPYEAAARRLEELQRENGGWRNQDGPDIDVHTTLDALRALKIAGRW